MHMRWQIKRFIRVLVVVVLFCIPAAYGAMKSSKPVAIDRVQLVTKQIALLKERYSQAKVDLSELQKQHDTQFSQIVLGVASKRILDKARLELAVDQSKQESIEIEMADTQQNIAWLEKNIQEIENQLNLLGIFGLKVAKNELANIQELQKNLQYKQHLLELEKERMSYLKDLQGLERNILTLKKKNQERLSAILKSNQMLNLKQQQVKEELAYQELQNHWLQQLALLRERLSSLDPVKQHHDYIAIERDIYVANENANYAYVQALIARYRDQNQQMKFAFFHDGNSVGLLNEISDQVVALSKQLTRLNDVIHSHRETLKTHIDTLSKKRVLSPVTRKYIARLGQVLAEYDHSATALSSLNKSLSSFRHSIDKALQAELASRQGFPSFGIKTFLDLGKELLLVPALTFHIVKSLTGNLLKGVQQTTLVGWVIFAMAQSLILFSFWEVRKIVKKALQKPSEWRGKINSKWLTLEWLNHNFIEFAIVGNLIGIMYFFNVTSKNYIFIVYLAFVWMIFKSSMTLARVCLIETTHSTTGHDVKLFNRLKWLIIVGGIVTSLTVFVHQLPLIYELKTLFDRLFLSFLMLVSLVLLRYWDVFPNMILSHIDSSHPYLQKSIRLIGFIIPLLIFINSLIGVFGYVNLIMTVSGYEGIFLIVLIAYLILRGLLSDTIEQLSKLLIQYSSNGWLWSEAFLKPLDKLLRIALFLLSCSVLFLLYGWDKQSTIVMRFNKLLHYKLAHFLNADITPLGIIQLLIVVAIFYWSAKWSREFVYRLLRSRMRDMGLRNSIAILTQYTVVVVGMFLCLQVLGIDLLAITYIVTALAFGVGLGLRDLVNNFASGFLILLERPLRVGDFVEVNGVEGEVINIGGRAVTVRDWDNKDMVIPNSDIFNKPFTNLTYKDSIVRCLQYIKISRHDNPHEISVLIQSILEDDSNVLKDPSPEVFIKHMTEFFIEFELRFYVNVRLVKSRVGVASALLMRVWDEFSKRGIKPPYPKQEILFENMTAPYSRA